VQNASTGIVKNLSEKTVGFMADVFAAAVGLAVMILALYYFFADGEHFLALLEYFSPLKYEDDMTLWRQFECISRSVVMGTLVAGLGQAILAGIGFTIAGVERVWLLTALTWLAALLPFVGAASIWGFVCIGLVIDGQYWTAGLLALYGTVIVSSSDNLIRAYIIGGNAKLHPLVVLVSVLGALQFIGLWGIFFGPMIASIFYALLKILRKRLPEQSPPPSPVAPCEIQPVRPATEPTETECLYLV
jgi:predicted PurR-regulated permease PerM